MQPKIAAICHRNIAAGATYDEHFAVDLDLLKRRVCICLERRVAATTRRFVGSDHNFRL